MTRDQRICEEILRKIMPLILTKATLRQPRPENNVKLAHYRGPVAIHLILNANHGDSTGRSFINIRRGKEWSVSFSCLPKVSMFGTLDVWRHRLPDGTQIEHNASRPIHLPFYPASSAHLAMLRDQNGRGKILPIYINLAYWMVEFGDVSFIEEVKNIDAIERDVTILLMETN